MTRFLASCFALLSTALLARTAHAEEPPSPGFYLRVLAGPDAMIGAHHVRSYFATSGGPYSYDETVATAGAQLALSAGWALGQHTALALDGALRLAPVLTGSTRGSLTGGSGYHVGALLDHYLSGRRGIHVQLGAGVEAFGFDGTTAVDTLSVQTISYAPGQTAMGPMALGGIGYDGSWFGVCARVEAAYLTSSDVRLVPVHVSINASVLYF